MSMRYRGGGIGHLDKAQHADSVEEYSLDPLAAGEPDAIDFEREVVPDDSSDEENLNVNRPHPDHPDDSDDESSGEGSHDGEGDDPESHDELGDDLDDF